MKQIINVELKTAAADFTEFKTALLAIGMFSDAKGLDRLAGQLDKKLGGAIENVIRLGDFKAKDQTSVVIYDCGNIGASRIILVGLGERKKATLDTLRKAAASAASRAVELKINTMGAILHRPFVGRFDLSDMGQAIAEGLHFGSYRYDEFVTDGEEATRPESLEAILIDSEQSVVKSLKAGLERGDIVGRAQSFARTVANRPANVVSPETLAETARQIARDTGGISCTIFDDSQLARKGMGGILAVGSGSKNRPRLIILRYKPASRLAASNPTIALVGKAITFDSGGLSLKPAANMEQMKLDKSGGIAAMATIKAAAQMKLPLNLLAIVPAAENMPGGASYRPGDIISTHRGKTIEVQNTDAEGRLLLADALEYAVEQNCDVIIDIATLTGSCVVALGQYMAGLMGNDDKLISQLAAAARFSGEKCWHMPSGDEYAEEMKSKIADLKNVGGKWGGACTAAAFLRQFVGDKKWAHLDIAGMDVFEKDTSFAAQGSSGFGVRLLITYLVNVAKGKGARRK